MQQLTAHRSKPRVYAFCRNLKKLDNRRRSFHSVVEGNARSEGDLTRALVDSGANTVIVSLGNGDSVADNDIRTASAAALVKVMLQEPFSHVKVVVVSSTGSSVSRIKIGLGIGKFLEYHLRHVLKDHTGQEAAFLNAIPDRTLIVRATKLRDYTAKPGKAVEFDDKVKSPSLQISRSEVAQYIAERLFDTYDEQVRGQIVNITSSSRR